MNAGVPECVRDIEMIGCWAVDAGLNAPGSNDDRGKNWQDVGPFFKCCFFKFNHRGPNSKSDCNLSC